MDLKTFIKETLVQIVEGVREAQDATGYSKVVPKKVPGNDQYEDWQPLPESLVKDVEFDVALTVEEESSKGAKIGVAAVIKGDMGEEKTTARSTVSRIKFSIPVGLEPR